LISGVYQRPLVVYEEMGTEGLRLDRLKVNDLFNIIYIMRNYGLTALKLRPQKKATKTTADLSWLNSTTSINGKRSCAGFFFVAAGTRSSSLSAALALDT